MTAAEYSRALKELTYRFEHSQGVLINSVSIMQNEEEINELDILITLQD